MLAGLREQGMAADKAVVNMNVVVDVAGRSADEVEPARWQWPG